MRAPLMFALLLGCSAAGAAEQTRTLPAFNGVSVQGPINMVVQAGKTQSVLFQGDQKFLNSVESKVVNGTLVITFPKNYKGENVDDARIVIAVPALRNFQVEGAGYAELNNISGDVLDIGFQGAGKLVARGSVKLLKLQAQGVGDVDTKDLLAAHANVSFEGIGTVRVHASERLDATVQGMGSLSYYGNPKTVNKSVEGIGSVRAAAR
ncbi:head GIN domain-containing protein [Massilia sp. CF038]|uniref:head GIN domain-containing protein n=1 Tax=Massilia sp. CF038 TaxID=1881045 RepID=UPI00091DBFDE|nr:head GIN domain-containing protein [Massilia sp. CF038]SHG98637.1 Putative auto-transporter adhesin, head GIN domain [Massilia sp. CF038]